ncbi:hypothetical protein ACFL0I_01245 [Gemmatimonadota bacterium]
MRRRFLLPGLALMVALVALAVPGANSLAGQTTTPLELSRPQFGLGFVANAPDAMAGASGYVILPILGGLGLYVDGKFDIEDPSGDLGYDPSLTDIEFEAQVEGARFIKREGKWNSFNVALVRPLNPYLMVYGGAGIASAEYYAHYETLTQDNQIGRAYLVRAPAQDDTRVNFMVGAILRISRTFSSQFGFETQPRGLTVGLSVRLPSW